MKKQNDVSQSGHTPMDDRIQKVLNCKFPLPPKVEEAQNKAFAKIRAMSAEQEREDSQQNAYPLYKNTNNKKNRSKISKIFFRGFIGTGVAAAIFFCISISNPAYAAQVLTVGNIFEHLEESLGFAGDFAELAEPVQKAGTEIESITVNGNTITLSEVYCNEAALYLSLMIHCEEKIPDTQLNQDNKPIIYMKNLIDFDFDQEGEIDWAIGGDPYIDGKMIDDHTFAGVLRYDMRQYFSGQNIEVPEQFQVKLSVDQIAGSRTEDLSPEMPKELRDQYEAGMKENGLGLTEEDYEQFTEEQKDIEHQLFSAMQNAYHEMYPETTQLINKYRDWLLDGPWEFAFDVTRNNEDVIRKEINDMDENGLGLISVTKTPMEITVEVEQNPDYFVTILDADGNEMEEGGYTGYTCTVAAKDHDTSKIDVYICDYVEYMDELKTYLWSEDYEEKSKEKTFKQLLDERALYHKEITFDE